PHGRAARRHHVGGAGGRGRDDGRHADAGRGPRGPGGGLSRAPAGGQRDGARMIRVLSGATLIDGTGAPPLADAAVAIGRERGVATGPRPALTWPADAEIIDARGRTVIPGLIDAHDHLASHGYGLATRWGLDEPASTAHLRTARVLAETLAMGYTTVRDGGGLDTGFKTAIEQNLIAG